MKLSWLAPAALCIPVLLFAQSNPSDFVLKNADGVLEIQSGGDIELEVDVKIPDNHHIYIAHATPLSMNIVTSFSTPEDSGWSVEVVETPAAEEYETDMILRGKGRDQVSGTYKILLSEVQGRNVSRRAHRVPINIRTQMCDSETDICFRPTDIRKNVRVRVTEERQVAAAIGVRSASRVNWVTTKDQALEKARESDQNVLVLITASWCGPCQRLERSILSQGRPSSFLNEGFVNLRIDSENRSELGNFNFSGYPTLIVMDKNGSEITRSVSRSGPDQFINSLSAYSVTESADPDTGTGGGIAVNIGNNARIAQSGPGKWTLTTGGNETEFEEVRRDQHWALVFDSRRYLAVPVAGRGNVQEYSGGQWQDFRP